MLERIKTLKTIKKWRRSPLFSRVRQNFPMQGYSYNDTCRLEDAEVVKIDWPEHLKKPKIGLVKDYGPYPRYTKYARFLSANSFSHDFFNIHGHHWLEEAKIFDIILGIRSSEPSDLEEIRIKYFFLERYLGKTCYPGTDHAFLYEDKSLEAYLSRYFKFPFVKTFLSYDKAEAEKFIRQAKYPMVHKIFPSSGSMGVELVPNMRRGQKIVAKAFSRKGRPAHLVYSRQKDYVYFQEYVVNDGFDIRIIVVGNRVFGYYRKVLPGDFRASGMDLVEKRGLPEEAMKIARNLDSIIKSPMLVVDMLRGLDGQYYVIEFSPFCQMETPEQLHVDGVAGAYIFNDDGGYHFEPGKYWVHELALKEVLLKFYLPRISARNERAVP